MKTGGTYLQDELLEEEKHERPQRNYFFLGRPWPICSWKERERTNQTETENTGTWQDIFSSHLILSMFLCLQMFSFWRLLIIKHFTRCFMLWAVKNKQTDKIRTFQRRLQYVSSALYCFSGTTLNVGIKTFRRIYQQFSQNMWHTEPFSHFINTEEFVY